MADPLSKSIQARVAAGEDLVQIHNLKLLAHVDPATRWRWAMTGKMPAVRMGCRYFTTDAAIAEWLASNSETKPEQKSRRSLEIDAAMNAVLGR